jgi:hypothetical protein
MPGRNSITGHYANAVTSKRPTCPSKLIRFYAIPYKSANRRRRSAWRHSEYSPTQCNERRWSALRHERSLKKSAPPNFGSPNKVNTLSRKFFSATGRVTVALRRQRVTRSNRVGCASFSFFTARYARPDQDSNSASFERVSNLEENRGRMPIVWQLTMSVGSSPV